MRELNLGEHTLGPGGYRVAEPIWDKEDAERAEQGLPPRFEKYSGNKQTKNYVRARYKEVLGNVVISKNFLRTRKIMVMI